MVQSYLSIASLVVMLYQFIRRAVNPMVDDHGYQNTWQNGIKIVSGRLGRADGGLERHLMKH